MLLVGSDFPCVDVTLRDATVSIPLTAGAAAENAHVNVLSSLASALTAPFTRTKASFASISGANAAFRAGRATCVLSAPGGGATTLLRLIAGREQCTAGAVTYNGEATTRLAGGGVQLNKLAALCGAADVHETHLTVAEALNFAYNVAVVPPPPAGALSGSKDDLAGAAWSPPNPDEVIHAFGLQRASNTIAGGMLNRGLSGGERRRLSVAETVIANARVLALDQPVSIASAFTAFFN